MEAVCLVSILSVILFPEQYKPEYLDIYITAAVYYFSTVLE